MLNVKVLQHEFDQLVKEYDIPEKPNLLYPSPGEVPIKGLHIHKNGCACLAPECSYACLSINSMQVHWKKEHTHLLSTFKPDMRCRHPAHVQSYYAHTSNKYWSVDPTLADRPPNNLYRMFRTEFLCGMETDDEIDPPSLPRDIPPWLKVSDFHSYLGDHLLNKERRLKLVDAATHPRAGHPEYGKLHEWVFDYMKEVRHISRHKVPYTIMKWLWSMDPL